MLIRRWDAHDEIATAATIVDDDKGAWWSGALQRAAGMALAASLSASVLSAQIAISGKDDAPAGFLFGTPSEQEYTSPVAPAPAWLPAVQWDASNDLPVLGIEEAGAWQPPIPSLTPIVAPAWVDPANDLPVSVVAEENWSPPPPWPSPSVPVWIGTVDEDMVFAVAPIPPIPPVPAPPGGISSGGGSLSRDGGGTGMSPKRRQDFARLLDEAMAVPDARPAKKATRHREDAAAIERLLRTLPLPAPRPANAAHSTLRTRARLARGTPEGGAVVSRTSLRTTSHLAAPLAGGGARTAALAIASASLIASVQPEGIHNPTDEELSQIADQLHQQALFPDIRS